MKISFMAPNSRNDSRDRRNEGRERPGMQGASAHASNRQPSSRNDLQVSDRLRADRSRYRDNDLYERQSI